MSSYDFMPSINSVRFIRSQSGDNSLHELETFNGAFEVALEVEIGGLNYLVEPVFKVPQPFYLTVVTYTVEGDKGQMLHGFRSIEYDEERLISGANEDNLSFFVAKFGEGYTPDEIVYDFVTTSLKVKLLYSQEELVNLMDIERYLYDKRYVLFETKIPFVTKGKRELGEYNA
ncbi:hypothetical protein [Enterococcus sp. CR-Ec1]|uniref:hypothetical protein n=1 Tax=Enterococcus sp. CR-Ec1 TaxID=2057791 RepID=UPI000C789809|nr:hypothetical protein [Enterococcus sp. CR-Ec1]AUJ85753.1 hypothetical protein CXM95_09925 [Enterococcus sp. CR-Ec1]